MHWYNEPPAWTVAGDALQVSAKPKSDFWRKTHYGFIRDSGHFYYQEVRGDFSAEVKVIGQYASLYDQAGLMLRLDEAHWLKCGVEFVEGVQHASVVVTRDYSDWSVVPLPHNPPAIWLRLVRLGSAIEVFYSLDGEHYTMIRTTYLPEMALTQVGPMCAAPEGPGFEVRFEGFRVETQ
jgi:hypothetical protein